jgi:hypothetical protein
MNEKNCCVLQRDLERTKRHFVRGPHKMVGAASAKLLITVGILRGLYSELIANVSGTQLTTYCDLGRAVQRRQLGHVRHWFTSSCPRTVESPQTLIQQLY